MPPPISETIAAPNAPSTAQNSTSSTTRHASKLSQATIPSIIKTTTKTNDAPITKDVRPGKLSRRISGTQATHDSNANNMKTSSVKDGGAEDLDTEAAIDPLSHHILKRTNTQYSIPQRLRTAEMESATGSVDGKGSISRTSSDLIVGRGDGTSTPPLSRNQASKDNKKKGVSFLSRIIGTKKKDSSDIDDGEGILPGDDRTAGMDAEVFAQPTGFTPKFPMPPRYIRIKAQNKKEKEFDRVFLAQELRTKPQRKTSIGSSQASVAEQRIPGAKRSSNNAHAIWAMEFSTDGKYLAAAGQDRIVRVWAVISSEEDRAAHEKEEEKQQGNHLNAPVFKSKPIREYEGHTASVLDLSWSKNNFLLSSSMDKTVCLWHVSRPECLCCFKHHDFVTSIAFHPRDDRFFLAGSLDSKVRLWSIPDKALAYVANVPDMVTAVAFSPDGKIAIAGTLTGLCLFFDTEGLKLTSTIHVRSARGKNAKGSKITGIDTITEPPTDPDGAVKILISSNDSRVRLYNLADKTLETKFRGNENTCSQIHATFSDDGKYVICGSEDRRAHIWPMAMAGEKDMEKRPVEVFEAHSAIVTTALIAPTKTKRLLSASADPLYDLCNPPPVTLLSRAESMISSSQAPTDHENGVEETEGSKKADHRANRAVESPAWVAKSGHAGGNIICTADYQGTLKIFRQDCAHAKRDNWDAGSTLSKKLLKRNGSVATRTSLSGRSNRNSIASFRSEVFGGHASGAAGDHRILSWRNSISATGSMSSFDAGSGVIGTRTIPRTESVRSNSPRKSISQLSSFSGPSNGHGGSHSNLAAASKQQSIPVITATPPLSRSSSDIKADKNTSQAPSQSQTITSPPRQAPSSTLASLTSGNNPLFLSGNQSYAFWRKTASLAQSKRAADSRDLLDPNRLQREESSVSALSSDFSSEAEGGEEAEKEKEKGKGKGWRG